MTVPATPEAKAGGLVILDVDGVVFRGQLMIALARRRGAGAFLLTVADCLLFDAGRITVKELLRRAYGRLRGMTWAEIWDAYRRMPLAPNAAEAVRRLRADGKRVLLLTAGVPDPIVKDLAARLGADDGAGMHAETRGDRLTGAVSGELARSGGKLRFVERVVQRDGIQWRDVIAVGDDRNNLEVMRRAGVCIGFGATYRVRQEARHLVDDGDLLSVLRYTAPATPGPSATAPREGRRPWHREILRKLLHMTAATMPFLATRFPLGTSALLLFSMAVYLVSEFWRINGVYLPMLHPVSRLVLRRTERRRMAPAPLTLALGVLVALWCLPPGVGMACILIAAIADSVAAVVGERWGRVPWRHNPLKSVEGSAAFFVTAVACAAVYLPLAGALTVAAVATALESLPLQDWDNFVTPVGTGIFVVAIGI